LPVAAVACICAILLSGLGPFRRAELAVRDHLFRLRGERTADPRLSLILVDRRTVEKLGFPFSRRYHAVLANALSAAGAKVVAFDLIFNREFPQDGLGDRMLAEVTTERGNVVHAWYSSLGWEPAGAVAVGHRPPLEAVVRPGRGTLYAAGDLLLPYRDLSEGTELLGIVSAVPDVDGVVRRMPTLVMCGSSAYPSFALLTACLALEVPSVELRPNRYLLLRGREKELRVPVGPAGMMIVNYTGGMGSIPKFSFYDVYEAAVTGEPVVPISEFRDKVVIVGASDPVGSDVYPTPFGYMPGVVVNAMAVDTILGGRFLREAPYVDELVMSAFTVAAAVAVALSVPWLVLILIFALSIVVYLSFTCGLMLSSVQPALGMVLSSLGVALLCGQVSRRRRPRWRVGEVEELVKLVDRDAPELDPVLNMARRALGAGFGGILNSSGSAAVPDVAAAIYDALRCGYDIRYDYEPANPGEEEQEVRPAGEVLREGVGTCLDLVLLYAALLERAHVAPAVIVVLTGAGQWHALGGYFVDAQHVGYDVIVTEGDVRDLVSSGALAVVEVTGISAVEGRKRPFAWACEEGRKVLQEAKLVKLLDVLAARDEGLLPGGKGKGGTEDGREA